MAKRKSKKRKTVETLTHEDASRKNIPPAELESVVPEQHAKPIEVAYERKAAGLEEEKANRNRDLDPQLVWRGGRMSRTGRTSSSSTRRRCTSRRRSTPRCSSTI